MGNWKEGVRCGEGEEFDPQGQSIFYGFFENDERGTALEGKKNAISNQPAVAAPAKPPKSADLTKSKTEESTSKSFSATASNHSSSKSSDKAHSPKKGIDKVKSWFRRVNVFQ